MNKSFRLLILIVFCTFLTGCWNYQELNNSYIVAGVAIDKSEDPGLYDVTIESVNMKDTDYEPNMQSYKIETMGEGIFDAVRDMIKISSKKLYWSHVRTLVVSEDVARDSILPTLDWIARDQEPRLAMDIYISRANTAKEIFDSESFATDIRSFELDVMINENENLINVPTKKVYELINDLALPKTHTVLPVIEIDSIHGKMTNVLCGGAVFNNDRLVGFLDNEDILPYLFIKNKVNGGLINAKDEEVPNDDVILEIFKNKTRVNPIITEENISFDIEIYTDVTIGELKTETDYISKPEPGRDDLKKLAEENLESDIIEVIKKVQSQFGLDIFGFGNIIRQRNPKLWKTIEDDWDTIFMDLDVNVMSNIHIRNSGHFSKPIEVVR